MLVQLIQCDNDSGHSGARMGQGPGQIIAGGAAVRLRGAGHQVETIRVDSRSPFPTEIATAFETGRELARQIRMALRQRRFPIVLAGNCFASVGAVAGQPPGRVGVVWLDAHADFHTPETTHSGFLDGMSLATLVGDCWTGLTSTLADFRPVDRDDILLLGGRDIDEAERDRLERSAVFWLEEHAMRSEGERLRSAVDRLGARTERIHLHIDLDVLDPEAVARANEFTPPGGMDVNELLEIVGLIQARCRVSSATVASYDPSQDPRNRLRDAALELVSALAV